MRVLVVVPTYEEAENIEELLTRLRAAAPDVDVLVIDDNSPDGTAKLAEELGSDLGRVDVVVQRAKGGLGTAYRAGFGIGLERGYDALVQMDADLSHDPAALPPLLAALDGGADLVIGSRYVPGGSIPNWPFHRRALSRYGNRYAGAVLGLPVRDATSGFRVFRATTLVRAEYTTTRATGYGFQIEMAYRVFRSGGRIDELPIEFTDRMRGLSKMTMKVASEELLLVTWWGLRDRVLRRRRPPR